MPSRIRGEWVVIFGGDNLPMADLLSYAQMAEDAGADSIWTVEVWRGAFVPLTAIARVTYRVRLGTGIAQFARSPTHTELSAPSLAEVSGSDLCWAWAPRPRSGTPNGMGSCSASRSPACGSTSNASARCRPPAPRTRRATRASSSTCRTTGGSCRPPMPAFRSIWPRSKPACSSWRDPMPTAGLAGPSIRAVTSPR
jgi:hypothetical protein